MVVGCLYTALHNSTFTYIYQKQLPFTAKHWMGLYVLNGEVAQTVTFQTVEVFKCTSLLLSNWEFPISQVKLHLNVDPLSGELNYSYRGAVGGHGQINIFTLQSNTVALPFGLTVFIHNEITVQTTSFWSASEISSLAMLLMWCDNVMW